MFYGSMIEIQGDIRVKISRRNLVWEGMPPEELAERVNESALTVAKWRQGEQIYGGMEKIIGAVSWIGSSEYPLPHRSGRGMA